MKQAARRRLLKAGVAAVAVPEFVATALASDGARRPLSVIAPYAAGGGTDALLRSLAPVVGRNLGRTVVIDNRPGASGMLAPTLVARAAPDGNTIGVLAEAALRIPQMRKVAFDPRHDFSYVCHLAGYSFSLVVRSDAPWQTWQEFAQDAKRHPGKYSFGSVGQYAAMHLTMEELMLKAGLSLLHVPYKGESEIVTAMLSSQVDLCIAGSSVNPHVQAGKARPLLQWTEVRNRRYPDVPTMRDMGYGLVSQSPFGLIGPKGMESDSLAVIQSAFKDALQSAEGRAALERLDMLDTYLDSADYKAYVASEYERQSLLIDRLGWQKVK